VRSRFGVQINVLSDQSTPKERARMHRRFLAEVFERVTHEQSGTRHYPTRTAGQFYLRRGLPGSSPSHQSCRAAVAAGVLDPRFVGILSAWGFDLLHPR
jgi:hypothetical protein